jgi:hypothetical protein
MRIVVISAVRAVLHRSRMPAFERLDRSACRLLGALGGGLPASRVPRRMTAGVRTARRWGRRTPVGAGLGTGRSGRRSPMLGAAVRRAGIPRKICGRVVSGRRAGCIRPVARVGVAGRRGVVLVGLFTGRLPGLVRSDLLVRLVDPGQFFGGLGL